MKLSVVSLLVFFVLFCCVHPFNAILDEDGWNKECPPFKCGSLGGGKIQFPYANETQPDFCGPFVLEGCNNKNQTYLQVKPGGKNYEVHDISQDGHVLVVTDIEFQKRLATSSCDSFDDLELIGYKQPYPPFQLVSSNITLFKCAHSVKFDDSSYLELKNTGCVDKFTILHDKSSQTNPRHPPHCKPLLLPINTAINLNKSTSVDIFGLLIATFSIQSTEYFEDWWLELCSGCFEGGGKCDPICRKRQEGNTKWKPTLALSLGLGGPAAMMILFFIWCRYKRKNAHSNFTSRNTTSDQSLTSFLDRSNVYFTVPIFTYDELEEATNNFDSEGELGDGGFGIVYYGRLRDGREVAVKRLYERNYKKVLQFMNEIEILTRLHHKNLVSLYGCTSRHSRELVLVYEYIPNGTVADHLHGDRARLGQLTWPIRMRIAIETASALSYLHASDIIHRDVKTNNILLDKTFCVKVADFGISRLFPCDVTHISTAPQGTPGYLDPEYHQCYQLTDKSDVYSFGVVLIELISSLPAVDITRDRHEINLANFAINKIQKCLFEELIDPYLGHTSDEEVERMTTSVAELAFRCLQHDKEMRPSMDEVLQRLKMIEEKEYESENQEEMHDDNESGKWMKQLHKTADSGEITSVKNIQPVPSSDSSLGKWSSSSSIAPNVSD